MKWSELSSRERDALVAKHALGCQSARTDGQPACGCDPHLHRDEGGSVMHEPYRPDHLLAHYTSDWGAMEAVVKAMGAKGYRIEMIHGPFTNGAIIQVLLADADYAVRAHRFGDLPMPELVAFVCLRALGVEIEE